MSGASVIDCADRKWRTATALDAPLHWRKSSRVRVVDDLFHEALPDEAIATVFGVMAVAATRFGGRYVRGVGWTNQLGPHVFQVLTKRPQRMRTLLSSSAFRASVASHAHRFAIDRVDAGWLSQCISGVREAGNHCTLDKMWPLPNVWLGVSVEDQATADERIPHLLATPAAVRFVSYEPALGPVNFRSLSRGRPEEVDGFNGSLRNGGDGAKIDWLIVGGESGPGARPCDLAWVRSAVAQCKAASVPVFVKQLGARPCDLRIAVLDGIDEMRPEHLNACGRKRLRDPKGGDPSEWPEDLRVREFPR